MIQNDLLGVAIVYIYVAILLFLTEKILYKYPAINRKILHILTGNIAFILPIFQTREIMAFVAAGPFILFTYLMSPYTPIKSIKGKTSAAGHGMGLVYYAITWTILAYVFFDNMVIIAIAILAMSYGDGFASLIGVKYGRLKYKMFGDEKSLEGSFAMLIFSFVLMIIAILFYQIEINFYILIYLLIIAIILTIVEGITPKGLDNLSVPFIAALCYWFLIIL
jgi:dolichol kinase